MDKYQFGYGLLCWYPPARQYDAVALDLNVVKIKAAAAWVLIDRVRVDCHEESRRDGDGHQRPYAEQYC